MGTLAVHQCYPDTLVLTIRFIGYYKQIHVQQLKLCAQVSPT